MTQRSWLTSVVDVVVGGVAGLILGGLVAVNLVIYSGVERGYEANLGEVFDRSVILGSIVVLVLVAGPVGGVVAARARRARGGRRQTDHWTFRVAANSGVCRPFRSPARDARISDALGNGRSLQTIRSRRRSEVVSRQQRGPRCRRRRPARPRIDGEQRVWRGAG